MGASVGNKGGFVAEINVTPFVDVMLVLLIIFMVTAPMMSEGLEVDLPQTRTVEVLPTDSDHLVLTIRKDGVMYLDERESRLEELATSGEGFHEVGTEPVSHVGQQAVFDMGVGLAEDQFAGQGFVDTQFDERTGGIALRPACCHHEVGPCELEALEVDVRGLVALHNRAAKDGPLVDKTQEWQEAQVLVDETVELDAHARHRGARRGAEGGSHGKVETTLTRAIDVHLHGACSRSAHGKAENERKAREKAETGTMAHCTHPLSKCFASSHHERSAGRHDVTSPAGDITALPLRQWGPIAPLAQ